MREIFQTRRNMREKEVSNPPYSPFAKGELNIHYMTYFRNFSL